MKRCVVREALLLYTVGDELGRVVSGWLWGGNSAREALGWSMLMGPLVGVWGCGLAGERVVERGDVGDDDDGGVDGRIDGRRSRRWRGRLIRASEGS